MSKIFKIKKGDSIKALMTNKEGIPVASLYGDEFTSIGAIENALIMKKHHNNKIDVSLFKISIVNITTGFDVTYTIKNKEQ